MVCASIMCNHWRRSFRRSQLAQPKRQEQIDSPDPGEQKHVMNTTFGTKEQHSSDYNNQKKKTKKQRDLSSGYEKMKNPTKQQKKK